MEESTQAKRPAPGEYYQSKTGDLAEVRAVSDMHVVCDAERVFTRKQFGAEYERLAY